MFNFGPEAAQNDTELLSYFHTTQQVKTLINQKISTQDKDCIFAVRPGGGKTALVKWLNSEEHQHNVLVLPTSKTRFITDDSKPNIEDYRNLISAELYAWMISESLEKFKLSEPLREKLKEYFKWSWTEPIKGFFKGKFEGLTILGFGFSLKASDRKTYLKEIREKNKIAEASELLKQISEEIKLVLVIEDPELIVGEGLQEEITRDNSIRIGAFLSVVNTLHSLGIQVVTFVKEHILQGVQKNYGDFSHFEGSITGLKWTEKDLMDMLLLRIKTRFNQDWNNVFEMSQKKFKSEILPFMINGPRDLIFVCNQAGKGNGKVSKISLEKSIHSLRASKWIQIENQFSVLWPGIHLVASTVCELISKNAQDNPISRENFREILKTDFSSTGTPLHSLRNHESWMFTMLWATPSIEERLFYLGCIGYLSGDQKIYSWYGRSINEFNQANQIFINPLFTL